MAKIDVLKNALDKMKAFEPLRNSTVDKMVLMLGDSVPYGMSVALANYTMASFVGHFQWKIQIEENNAVPVNVISFVLAKSGAKKTSSVKKLRKSLNAGYNLIERKRLGVEIERAKNGEGNVNVLKPLVNALSTQEGLIRILNEFNAEGIGLPSLFVDEIATELATSSDIVPNIKLISQLFDDGDTESKALKDVNNQSAEVKGMGMNALFMGSEYGILEDEAILRDFEREFMSKLGRRCFFVYPDAVEIVDENNSSDELLDELYKNRNIGNSMSKELGTISIKIAKRGLLADVNRITIEKKAHKMIDLYMLYNAERSALREEEILQLEESHREWKVLKLAGVYAIFKGKNSIGVKEIREAITIAEMLSVDLAKFTYKANRQTFEKLCDYFLDGRTSIKIHELVKKKWVRNEKEIEPLLILVNSKLEDFGMVLVENNKVIIDRFETQKGVSLTYKKVKGTKAQRSSKVTDGFKTFRKDFDFMQKVISSDTAYTNVSFKGGVRSKNNVEGKPDFLILDVDDTDVTDTECSNYLMDYNHIICRTSNKDNPYKYRILLPTDIAIGVTDLNWKAFLEDVSADLGIAFDMLPKSQIFYGYADRKVLVNKDCDDYPIKDLVHNVKTSTPKQIKPLSKSQMDNTYDQRYNIFKWFYEESLWGKGKQYHNSLFLFSRNSAERGVPLDVSIAILYDIVDYRERKPRDGYMDSLVERMSKYPEYQEQTREY